MYPLYSTVLYSTVEYSTVQYSTVQYSTVQYSTVQYSTVQYSTVQYSKMFQGEPVRCIQYWEYISSQLDPQGLWITLGSNVTIVSSLQNSHKHFTL